jgi:DNA ligase (NAD+)
MAAKKVSFRKAAETLLNKIKKKQDFSDLNLRNCKKVLEKAFKEYTYNGSSFLTDDEYDTLHREYYDYEDVENLNLQKPSSNVKNVKHTNNELLGTLDNVFSVEELGKWLGKIKTKVYPNLIYSDPALLSYKFDGCSGAFDVVDYCKIVKAYSRGSHGEGLDLYKAIYGELTSESIKGYGDALKEFTLKCEIVMTWSDFELYSEKYEKKHNKKPSNPRYTVSSIFSMSDPSEYIQFLTLIPLDIVPKDKNIIIPRIERIEIMNQIIEDSDYNTWNGMPFVSFEVQAGKEKDIAKIYDHIALTRDELPYMIDGVVYELLLDDQRNELGGSVNSDGKWTPHYSVAMKLPCKSGVTTLKKLEYDVSYSVTGRITPCAVFKPVIIDGREFKRVSLSNFGRIKNENFKIGGKIMLTIRGDVLGYIERLEGVENEEIDLPDVEIPDCCPVCKSKVKWFNDNEVWLMCSNPECPSKKTGLIFNFIEKMGIKGIGVETVDFLVKNLYIKEIDDLYFIDYEELKEEPGFGEKSCKVIIDALNEKLKIKDYILLGSLGWTMLGRSKIKDISKKYSISDLLNLLEKKTSSRFVDLISSIEGFSKTLAKYLYNGLRNDEDLIVSLLDILDVEETKQTKNTSGKTYRFVITGSLKDFPERNDLKNFLEDLGHKLTSSVSGKTDYLIVGDSPGKNKISDAKTKEIKIIDEKEFFSLVNEE